MDAKPRGSEKRRVRTETRMNCLCLKNYCYAEGNENIL